MNCQCAPLAFRLQGLRRSQIFIVWVGFEFRRSVGAQLRNVPLLWSGVIKISLAINISPLRGEQPSWGGVETKTLLFGRENIYLLLPSSQNLVRAGAVSEFIPDDFGTDIKAERRLRRS